MSSSVISYKDVQEVGRFARYWDLIGNSGRFKNTLALLMGDSPFERFESLSKSVFRRTGQTHKISLLRLYDLVYDIATEDLGVDEGVVCDAIEADFVLSGLKSIPKCLVGRKVSSHKSKSSNGHATRQSRH